MSTNTRKEISSGADRDLPGPLLFSPLSRRERAYGAARIHVELRAGGHRHGRKRIARPMRQAGLEGAHRRRFRRTTDSDPLQAPSA